MKQLPSLQFWNSWQESPLALSVFLSCKKCLLVFPLCVFRGYKMPLGMLLRLLRGPFADSGPRFATTQLSKHVFLQCRTYIPLLVCYVSNFQLSQVL